MVPYGNFYYFYVLMLVLAPAVVQGLLGIRIKWYGVAVSAYMIHVIFDGNGRELIFFIFFFAFEILMIYVFGWIFKKTRKRYVLWIALLLALAPLACAKLSGTPVLPTAIGFLGISYLTFKILQVLIQLYDRSIEMPRFYNLIYFILFFPTLSAGPIDRSARFFEDADRKLTRKEYIGLLGDGLFRIAQGVGYKFIIAYLLQTFWLNNIPPHSTSLLQNISYMYAYSLYLFFDFAGYSLIAVGVSNLLGIQTPRNFNLPFLSRDIKEFWNRWHMTLSFWFRDFVYNRFVMAALKNKWFKSKYAASYLGFLLTMTAMGLWHGLTVYYILYGAYHGCLIVATDWLEKRKLHRKLKTKKAFGIVSVLITFNLICFGFYIFSGYSFN
ncbi:MAG: D-alanyl-lipoteichoic acid biosynthesis protein DltB [Eubacteriales bacterium]